MSEINMNKVETIKKYGKIIEKDTNYFIFSGLLNCLNPQETVEAFNFNFDFGISKRGLFIYKITSDIKKGIKKLHIDFFKKLLNTIYSLDTYHKKQACSQFLFELFNYMPFPQQDQLIKYLLLSQYKNDRKRAYDLLSIHWSSEYKKILEKVFLEFSDFQAVDLLIEKMSSKYLFKNIDQIYPFFLGEYLDFEELKLRNKLLIKVSKFVKYTLIRKLKEKDPISYIFIAKESNLKVDEKFAFELFCKHSHKNNLISWYGQIGLWDTILKIKNFLTN